MLTFDNKGIYCARADLYIDPWFPVNKAIITHAHADHAHKGSKHYLCQTDTAPLLKLRLGNDISIETLNYGKQITINGVRISLHPAGHIIGSSQVRLSFKDEVWVVSGDYKLQDDGLSTAFEPLKCQHFITESTFGLPIYHFPKPDSVKQELFEWILKNNQQAVNSLLVGYSLGKAQRIIEMVSELNIPIYAHGAIVNIQQQLINAGHKLHPVQYTSFDLIKTLKPPYLVVLPPSAIGTPWLKKFNPYKTAFFSGWMQLRGARRRRNVARGFVLSDHADWNQLNSAVLTTNAENIYVTHGYKSIFAKWLRDEHKLNAVEVETLYEDDLLMREDTDATL